MAAATFNYLEESQRVKDALRGVFAQNSTIVTSEGYNGRVHVKVVSELFNGKTEQEKQAFIWEVLQDHLGPEAQAVSLAIAYGTDEL